MLHEWKQHPMTQVYMRELEKSRHELLEQMAKLNPADEGALLRYAQISGFVHCLEQMQDVSTILYGVEETE